MQLHFTSGYYPEGDGQTKRMNQTLEQYLRVYCNYQQDNWSELLPLVEFAYNNALSATTRVSPFFANKGYHPNITVHPKHNCRSRWFTEYSQSWNLCSLTALSEICWCTAFPHSWFQSRWQSLYQGLVFLNHLAFKKTLWKISWTLWNHFSAWHSIVHSPSSRVHVLCSSSLPCVHAWTHHIQHFLWENTASPCSSHNWQGTQIWNFSDSGF